MKVSAADYCFESRCASLHQMQRGRVSGASQEHEIGGLFFIFLLHTNNNTYFGQTKEFCFNCWFL